MRDAQRHDGTLVYDGDCAFCTRCVGWMQRFLPLRPTVVAWQDADLASLGLTRQACELAVQWVEPGAPTRTGAAAVARILVLSGGAWSVLGRVLQVRPVSRLAAAGYGVVARNRDRMPGGTAACALPQDGRDALRHDGGPAA